MRIADSLARQLQAFGLERRERPAPSLAAYIVEKYGGEPDKGEGNDCHNRHTVTPPDPEIDGQERPGATDDRASGCDGRGSDRDGRGFDCDGGGSGPWPSTMTCGSPTRNGGYPAVTSAGGCDHTWIASALRPRCPACGFDGLAMERE